MSLYRTARRWLAKQFTGGELESIGLYLTNGYRSASGAYVSADTALQAATVYACVTFLGDIMGMLPCQINQKTGTTRRAASNHPLYDILHSRPNPYMSAFVWRRTMVTNLAIYGRAYSLIQRRNGRITALWPIPSSRVRMDVNDTVPRLFVRDRAGVETERTTDEIFMVQGFSLDGYEGMSPIDVCRNAIGLAITTEGFVAKFFANGTWPGMMLEYPGAVTDEGIKQIREQFEAEYGGSNNAYKVGVLEGGVKLHQVPVDSQKSQLIESRNFSIEEICRIWRIPPHVIQHLLRSTFSNISHQGIEVRIFTIQPIATNFEGAIDNQLLTAEDRANGVYSRHNLDALERGDFESRTRAYVSLTGGPIMRINEARALEELDPVDGGDVVRVQMQNVPITAPAGQTGVTP